LKTVISTAEGSYLVNDDASTPPIGGDQLGVLPIRINSNTHYLEYYDFDNSAWEYIKGLPPSIKITVATAGTDVTSNELINRFVNAVSINDTYKVTGFSKSYASNTIVFTDSTLSVGDIVVAYLG
jgi:hypothetical protein